MPTFHLIRAMHMAERCIECHACESACPMGIPLTIFYRLMARDMMETFGYEKGHSIDDIPPINLKGVEAED